MKISSSSGFRRRRWWLWVGGLGAGAVMLGWQGFIHALDGPHDSLRYLAMAESLLRGEWLGPYNHMTLIRQPVYPLFVALSSLTGWPLHVVQHGLYVGSALLLSVALRACRVAPWRIVVAFGLCVFHPLPFWTASFLATEALYLPLACLILAGMLGTWTTMRAGAVRFSGWLTLLCASLALAWHARAESVWLVLFGAGCTVLFLMLDGGRPFGRHRLRLAIVVLAASLSVLLLGRTLAGLNERSYGIRVTHELAEPNFRHAFQRLTRLAPESQRPYVPITTSALETAYRVSPHFARLQPFLAEQRGGKGWSRFGCEWMKICDELVDGWAMWAIRDAAALAGAYGSAAEASGFYAAVAREIRQACEAGKIPCSRNPTGNLLSPPVSLRDIPRILRSAAGLSWLALAFGDLPEGQPAVPEAHAEGALAERYARVTHDQQPRMPLYAGPVVTPLHFLTYEAIQIGGGLLAAGCLLLTAGGLRTSRWQGWNDLGPEPGFLLLSLLLFMITRIAVVAYLDAMSFTAQIRYLLVIYPPLMVLIALAIPVRQKDPGHRHAAR